jgi:hypothetical protein
MSSARLDIGHRTGNPAFISSIKVQVHIHARQMLAPIIHRGMLLLLNVDTSQYPPLVIEPLIFIFLFILPLL